MKTLQDFKQEVAEGYGYMDWQDATICDTVHASLATDLAERYAEYRAKEAEREGYNKGLNKGLNKGHTTGYDDGYDVGMYEGKTEGWNEGLKWAIENAYVSFNGEYYIVEPTSISKGLKL